MGFRQHLHDYYLSPLKLNFSSCSDKFNCFEDTIVDSQGLMYFIDFWKVKFNFADLKRSYFHFIRVYLI